MTSKKRRAARAWMSAERARSVEVADRRAIETRERADREWLARLTRIVPPKDEETIYPQGRLESPYIQVLAPERRNAAIFDPRSFDQYARSSPLDVIPLVAKQMAMVLPNGAKVIWWTWEIGR